MANFKLIDEALFQYVKEETRKRYPDIQFNSSSLGRGRLAVEDRSIWCWPYPNNTRSFIEYCHGYVFLKSDDRWDELKGFDLDENGNLQPFIYRSKYRIENSGSYQHDNAAVLDAFLSLVRQMYSIRPDGKAEAMKEETSTSEEVTLSSKSSEELFQMPLSIPDYQRIYCWEEENVRHLWQDIVALSDNKPYHLGAIILHKKGECEEMNVVDGQQRLVTLTLILHHLDPDYLLPLLNQTFQSAKAAQYVAYNYHLIGQYFNTYLKREREVSGRNDRKKQLKDLILKQLQFSVLTLSGDNLDLAYTFFSNQNSKGLSLSDYNLLKAHHLRFIPNEAQSKEVASHWDALLSTQSSNVEENVARTLGMFLFRLRKWRRKLMWDEDKKYRVKTEFEAAPNLPQIPAFGEQFNYYESIQGGAHFFAYTEKFVHMYKKFREEKIYQLLENHLSHRSHWRYKDVIQTMLFAYYVKFGDQYLDLAFLYIEPLVSEHRYTNVRALHYKILQTAADTDIVMMIDQATSPTFFLAEAKNRCESLPLHDEAQFKDIQKDYKSQICHIREIIDTKNQ